jgi:hypothetical protein
MKWYEPTRTHIHVYEIHPIEIVILKVIFGSWGVILHLLLSHGSCTAVNMFERARNGGCQSLPPASWNLYGVESSHRGAGAAVFVLFPYVGE